MIKESGLNTSGSYWKGIKKDRKNSELHKRKEQKRKDISDIDEFIKLINGMVL